MLHGTFTSFNKPQLWYEPIFTVLVDYLPVSCLGWILCKKSKLLIKTWLCHLSAENVVVVDPGSGSGSGASSNASLLEGGHMHQILLLIFWYSGALCGMFTRIWQDLHSACLILLFNVVPFTFYSVFSSCSRRLVMLTLSTSTYFALH